MKAGKRGRKWNREMWREGEMEKGEKQRKSLEKGEETKEGRRKRRSVKVDK